MNLFWLIHYARAVDYNLIQPLPGVQKVSGFPEYIASILPFILSLAAVLAVVMIVIGGVEYAVSLSEEGKKNARGRINNAILGLLLALVSYLILYTINPDLTKLKLDVKGLPGGPTITLCQPACKIGEEICADGTCKTLSGGKVCEPVCKAGESICIDGACIPLDKKQDIDQAVQKQIEAELNSKPGGSATCFTFFESGVLAGSFTVAGNSSQDANYQQCVNQCNTNPNAGLTSAVCKISENIYIVPPTKPPVGVQNLYCVVSSPSRPYPSNPYVKTKQENCSAATCAVALPIKNTDPGATAQCIAE